MRVFDVRGEQFTELDTPPDGLPAAGFPWPGGAAAVQRHFSVLARRTSDIMRTLTVLAVVRVTCFRRERCPGRSAA